MSLSEILYKEIIIDHSANPRNFKKLENCDCSEDGHNPLCGDEIHLELKYDDGKISDIGLSGDGCSISRASASIMTESMLGLSKEEALQLFAQFKDMLVEGKDVKFAEEYEDIQALEGVRQYPVRIKCAILAWNTIAQALEKCEEMK